MGLGRVVEAVLWPALAPLANGLGADTKAPGQHTGGLARAGDLGADGRRCTSIGVDLEHGSPPSRLGAWQTFEAVGVVDNSQPDRVPTMFRDLTPSLTVSQNSGGFRLLLEAAGTAWQEVEEADREPAADRGD